MELKLLLSVLMVLPGCLVARMFFGTGSAVRALLVTVAVNLFLFLVYCFTDFFEIFQILHLFIFTNTVIYLALVLVFKFFEE